MDKKKIMLENWKIAQSAGAILPCPRCGKLTMKEKGNAVSRRADIYICDSCGTQEAVTDMCASQLKDVPEINSAEYKANRLKDWWIIKHISDVVNGECSDGNT